jgi:Flp pilus assembly pilin Flp
VRGVSWRTRSSAVGYELERPASHQRRINFARRIYWSRLLSKERQADFRNAIQHRPPMPRNFRRFVADESGETAIAYAAIAAVISIAIIAAVRGFGFDWRVKR